jgi:hypothetical protein
LDTDLEVRGKAAQFGRGVLGNVSQRILDQFARNLESEVLSSREKGEEPPSEEGAPTKQEEAGRTAAATAGGESLDVLSVVGSPMLRQAMPAVAGLVLGLLVGNLVASRKTVRAYQETMRMIGCGPMYGPPAGRWRRY